MKKIQVVVLSAIVAVGALVTSCGGGISSNVSLKTEKDSLSYAFAANLYKQGLDSYLRESKVLLDTSDVIIEFQDKIQADSTGTLKETLYKAMRAKVDSVAKLNERNIAEFLKGMQSSLQAPASKTPYLMGAAIGHQMGANMIPELMKRVYGATSNEKLNYDAFLAAMSTALQGQSYQMMEPDMYFNVKIEKIRKEEQAKRELEEQEAYKDRIAEGVKFLSDNKAKEGVVTLPSGLQYKVLKEGKGPKPTAKDEVEVHYHGTLIDGTVFDSSIERKQTVHFNVSAVIKGWTEALQLMPVGSKWMLYIPYNLAYGGQSTPGSLVPPYSTLIFEVELFGIGATK